MKDGEDTSSFDPAGNWPGKKIEWESEVTDAKLHVELPFWIAAPEGTVRIRHEDCELDIEYRNSIVGIYRNGIFYRDERTLMHITGEGYPHTKEEAEELSKAPKHGSRHFRTMLSIPVKCHECIFSLLDSSNRWDERDARMYVQSLAHASIRFINSFLSAYRAASYDPFASHVSYWDLPVWHLSKKDKGVWQVPMAKYPVSDTLPAVDATGHVYRTTVGRIREATIEPIGTSMEELLDAWTCFYRGQFAEAIRKAVTSIEVTVSDLLFELPAFRQNRNDEEVREHLVKMKFSDQFSFYLRETGRDLPGPLTHIAPEVNGVYLQKELNAARARRHKIVHESEKVDYEHDGPVFRIMETMSWLHGWLREDGGYSDPTQSVWHSANKQMRDIFPLEPIADQHGLRLVTPRRWDDEAPMILVQQIYTEKLLECTTKQALDIAFCIAWAFHELREPLIDGRRRRDRDGHHERFWLKNGEVLRPVFTVDTDRLLEQSDIDSIACRLVILQRRNPGCDSPLIVVNHLSDVDPRSRINVRCLNNEAMDVVKDLGFTVVSLMDWVAMVCLVTQHRGRDFGFRSAINKSGFIDAVTDELMRVGYVRRVFPKPEVLSIVVENDALLVGDEICLRNGFKSFSGVIESIQIKNKDSCVALAGSIAGVKLDIGVAGDENESVVLKVKRPRLILDETVAKVLKLEERDYSDILRRMQNYPTSVTGFGTYGGDQELG